MILSESKIEKLTLAELEKSLRDESDFTPIQAATFAYRLKNQHVIAHELME